MNISLKAYCFNRNLRLNYTLPPVYYYINEFKKTKYRFRIRLPVFSELEIISLLMARYLEFESLEKRKKSFNESFPIKGITPTEFAEAGFYSINNQDYVRCFFCGVGLRGWDNTDSPWKQHAKFSPNCLYLTEKYGKNFQGDNHANIDNPNVNDNKKNELEKGGKIRYTEEEIRLLVESRMAEEIIHIVLKYQSRLKVDKESIRKSLENQFTLEGDDFKNTESLVIQAHEFYKQTNEN